jgi:predicted permease
MIAHRIFAFVLVPLILSNLLWLVVTLFFHLPPRDSNSGWEVLEAASYGISVLPVWFWFFPIFAVCFWKAQLSHVYLYSALSIVLALTAMWIAAVSDRNGNQSISEWIFNQDEPGRLRHVNLFGSVAGATITGALILLRNRTTNKGRLSDT